QPFAARPPRGHRVKTGARGNARLAALNLLTGVLDAGRNLGDVALADPPDDARDRAFARHLAFGVLRWLGALEWLAGELLQRPLKARDRDIQRLVLLGLFQLWQDETPPHAAIHEAAGGARLLGKAWAVGLVNAVLRRFQREREDWLTRLAERDERFAHPAWLLDRLRRDWPDDWEAIVDANNRAAPLWLRRAPGADASELDERLARAGFDRRPHPDAPDALAIDPAAAAEAVPGFAEGLLSVQDPAAQLAAGLLEPAPNQRVLDACAAPGGKTCHLLERAPAIELLALDRSAERLERVRENLARLGFAAHPGLRLEAADAADTESWWDGRPFQRILLDAPCSSTGVIRRHPEIKWLRSPQQVAEAVQLQGRLLDRLWPLLEPGGILLYATCSVLREENQEQIERFLARSADAGCDTLDAGWGRTAGPGRQILPGHRDMDGFFYARLRKR
ncbi:MAG: 16S rRNA (cytosine(967)-C(5))-methyltransferase RsmB, partial [Xanthomonadales bacterium]|nr:16S rRNA (cytosine(967)-C(5))-methyltransferase RsmB [Xanthomonadales bacterium]